MLRWRIFRARDAPGAASGTPVLLFRGNYYFVGATVSSALFGRAVHEQKENRAGWPGSFCVELDAVTSQRGATGTEGCICAPQAGHRSKDLARQAETDYGQDASSLPCIYLFRLNPQTIVCIGVMQQLNLAHLRVPSKLGVKFCIGWGEFHYGVPRQMFMSPGGVSPLDTAHRRANTRVDPGGARGFFAGYASVELGCGDEAVRVER